MVAKPGQTLFVAKCQVPSDNDLFPIDEAQVSGPAGNPWFRLMLAAGAVLLAACGSGDSGFQGAVQAVQPKAASADTGFAGNGTWWNPSEPGTGFFFEAQAGTGVLTLFVFDAAGKPAWYSAVGPVALNESGRTVFSGVLLRYSGGQALDAAAPQTPASATVGAVQLAFDGDTAHVMLPQRAFVARKFNPTAQARPATGSQPETGIYWNPAESGRGYTIEVNGGVATIGVFYYDADGAPVWSLAVGDIAAGVLQAPLQAYAGGQTLGETHRPPAAVAPTTSLRAEFGGACAGSLVLPGGRRIVVQRFAFGSQGPGLECRSAQPPGVLNTTALPLGSRVTDVAVSLGSPSRVDANLMLGRSMPAVTLSMSLTASDAALAGRSYHAMVEDPDGLLESIQPPQVVGGNGRTLSSLLVPRRMTTAGERAGNFRILLCFDASCSQQLPAVDLPYRVNVRSLQTSKEAILVNSVPGQAPQTQALTVTVPKGAVGLTMRLKTAGGTVGSDAPPFSTNFPAGSDTAIQALVSLTAARAAGLSTNALVITLRFRLGEGIDEWVKEIPIYHHAAVAGTGGPVLLPASEVAIQLPRGRLGDAPLEPAIVRPGRMAPDGAVGEVDYVGYPLTAQGHPLARAWLRRDPSQTPPWRASVCDPYGTGGGACLPVGRYTARLPYPAAFGEGTETVHQVVVLDVVPW